MYFSRDAHSFLRHVSPDTQACMPPPVPRFLSPRFFACMTGATPAPQRVWTASPGATFAPAEPWTASPGESLTRTYRSSVGVLGEQCISSGRS